MTIISLDILPEIKIVSNLQLGGWNGGIISLDSDNYFLAITTESGEVTLIDAKDKTNPFIVSKYNSNIENAYNGCTDKNQEYSFIVSDSGYRVLPLKTNLFIHTEIATVTGENQGLRVTTPVPKNQPFTVQLFMIII